MWNCVWESWKRREMNEMHTNLIEKIWRTRGADMMTRNRKINFIPFDFLNIKHLPTRARTIHTRTQISKRSPTRLIRCFSVFRVKFAIKFTRHLNSNIILLHASYWCEFHAETAHGMTMACVRASDIDVPKSDTKQRLWINKNVGKGKKIEYNLFKVCFSFAKSVKPLSIHPLIHPAADTNTDYTHSAPNK